jgi:hypothetical protein
MILTVLAHIDQKGQSDMNGEKPAKSIRTRSIEKDNGNIKSQFVKIRLRRWEIDGGQLSIISYFLC